MTTPVFVVFVARLGVVAPLLFCVAKTEASLRDASETICFMFLFRR